MERCVEILAVVLGLRMMARVSVERAWEFQVAGVVLVLVAGVLGYGVYIG